MWAALRLVITVLCILNTQSTAVSIRSINILAIFDENGERLWRAFEHEVRLQNLEFEKAAQSRSPTLCVFKISAFPLWINNSFSTLQSLQELDGVFKETKYCAIVYSAFSSNIGKLIAEYGFANKIPVIMTTAQGVRLKYVNHPWIRNKPQSRLLTYEGSLSLSFGKDVERKADMLANVLEKLAWRKFAVVHDNTFDSLLTTSSLGDITNYTPLVFMKRIRTTSSISSIRHLPYLLNSLRRKGCQVVIVISDSMQVIRNVFYLLKGVVRIKKLLATNRLVKELARVDFSSDVVVVHPPKPKWTPHDVTLDSVVLISSALHRVSCDGGLDVPSYSLECPSRFYRRLVRTTFQGKSGLVEFDSDGRRRQTFLQIHKSVRTSGGIIWEESGYWNGQRSVITEENVLPRVRVVISECAPSVLAFPKLPLEPCQSSSLVCYKHVITPSGKKETQALCCRGYAIDVIRLLEAEAGFRSDLRFSKDGKFGVYDALNNSWNGIVSELIENKADLAVDLFVSSRRSKVVKFTEAYMPAGIALLVRERKLGSATIVWLSYLRPFTPNVWLTLLGTTVLMVLYLWAVERLTLSYLLKIADENQRSLEDSDNSEHDLTDAQTVEQAEEHNKSPRKGTPFIPGMKSFFDLQTAIFYTMAVACQRPADDSKPNTSSTRLAALSFSMAMLVFISAYSANLVAYLIVDDTLIPVKSIRDKKFQHPPPGFRYGTVRGTYSEDFFRNSQNMFFQGLWYNMRPNNVDTFEQGIQQLRSGALDVLIADNIGLLYAALNDQACELKVVGETFGMSGVSVAVRKQSIWFAPITDVLGKLKHEGLTDYIQDRWVKKYQCYKHSPPQQLSVTDISGVFLQLCIIVVLCILTVFLSCCLRYIIDWTRRKKTDDSKVVML